MGTLVISSDPQFERVVRECYDDVFRFACSLTKGNVDAADLTQQAFLRYARKGHQVRDRSKIKSWLFSVLRNEFFDAQRKIARHPHVELGGEHQQSEASESPDGQADWKVALAALRSLPDGFREPLTLYYLQGYTYQEIAEALDIPPGTVMSRLSRGKAKLRKVFPEIPETT